MARVTGIGQFLYDWKLDPTHNLGDTYETPEGDVYVYVKAGAVALVAGNVLQAPAQNTDHDQLVATAAAIGAMQITVTTGSSAVTANQYAGGKAVIDTTPGEGEEYIITGHPAASTTAALILTLKYPVRVALTTSSRVTLAPNKYRGVIQAPVTTMTGACVGVAVSAGTALYYGWIGKNGRFGTLIDQTPGVGHGLVPQAAAAGALAINSSTMPSVAIAAVTGVNGKILPCDWVL